MAYDFKIAEDKWQKHWLDTKAFHTDDESNREKFYCLAQFPYPSGAGLHMGHVEIYTYTDVLARLKRHQGYEVLHPMGWDAFGLPTENHAIREGIHPREITKRNCAAFRKQLDRMGFSYDWEREVDTTDPEYYRWTQWIWKRLHEAGLTYKKEMPVNWCDSCKIVVANEEVLNDGNHERCGNPTRRRTMKQWMFRITAYAQKLLDGLKDLDWPESSKKAQIDWIGRSEGAKVRFRLEQFSDEIEVYTTRPDTLFGATYMVLAPEHELVEKITTNEQRDTVRAYVTESGRKSDFDRQNTTEKTGVFTGSYAINPLNGNKIPVWIADYVLASYGTGAIMAVPAHDSRDFAFAKVFSLPIVRVLTGPDGAKGELKEAWEGDGELVNSSNDTLNLNGMNKKDAIRATIEWLESEKIGSGSVNYKIRDWIFARQRYWGEPFPVYYAEDGKMCLVPDSELPLTLPEVESYQPTDTGESPLANIDDWIEFTDIEGRKARRESDTMPQWAGSCWYYLRFMDPRNTACFSSLQRQKRWGRVDVYVGGTEHLNLHDLYSRFWHRALYDLGLTADPEPYQKLLHQGMILGPDGSKMSKSAGNIVNPDELIDKYGADVVRLNLCFMGPVEANKPWNPDGLEAMRKFIGRLDRLFDDSARQIPGDGDDEVLSELHRTIRGVFQDYERYQFNTVIAKLMELMNLLNKQNKVPVGALEKICIMLSPIAPHFCEEMWSKLGKASPLAREPFPEWKEDLCVKSEIEIAVQICGKMRERVMAPSGIDAKTQEELVLQDPKVQKRLEGMTIIKVICIPGRLVNVVAKPS